MQLIDRAIFELQHVRDNTKTLGQRGVKGRALVSVVSIVRSNFRVENCCMKLQRSSFIVTVRSFNRTARSREERSDPPGTGYVDCAKRRMKSAAHASNRLPDRVKVFF